MAKNAKPGNPKPDYITIVLPRPGDKEEPDLFVALNGKGYTIRRGTPVRVPRAVAAIVKESFRMQDRQMDYIDGLAKQQAEAAKQVPGAI